DGSSAAKAPYGMVAELRLARTCAVRYPRPAPMPRHSKARRVLPTPAGPANSTPPDSPSIAAATCVSSATRPTNGHVAVFTAVCLLCRSPSQAPAPAATVGKAAAAAPALESRPAFSHEQPGESPGTPVGLSTR